MELTGAALRRSPAYASPMVVRGRGRPARVTCVGRGGGGFADEGHLRYYEAAPRKVVEAAARDLAKLRAMGLVAGDTAKERVLAVSTPSRFLVSFPVSVSKLDREIWVSQEASIFL